MGIFSTRNNDGASSKAEGCDTISGKDWKALRARREKSAPPVMSDQAKRDREHTVAMWRATKRGEN